MKQFFSVKLDFQTRSQTPFLNYIQSLESIDWFQRHPKDMRDSMRVKSRNTVHSVNVLGNIDQGL